MKSILALLILLLLAGPAGAVVDPDADQLGVYFDPDADLVCRTEPDPGVFDAYLIYTRPTLSAVRGFECTVRVESDGSSLLVSRALGTEGFDLGENLGGGHIFLVGFYEPLPTTQATILVHMGVFVLGGVQTDFYLGPANPASLGSDYPLVVAEDYSLHALGYSAPEGPCATINGDPCQVVATDEATWDSIKAMYR